MTAHLIPTPPLPIPLHFFECAQPVWAGALPSLNAAMGIFWDVPAGAGRLRITSSGRFRVSINGTFFCHGPECATHGFARVEEWEIGPALTRPINRVAIEIVSPGIASYYTIKEPAFVRAEIVRGGSVIGFTAPEECGATGNPHRLQKVHRYSFQRPFSEVYRENPSCQAWGHVGPRCQPHGFSDAPLEGSQSQRDPPGLR